MPAPRPAAGGGRWVDVAPERIDGFLDRFARRHGPVATAVADDVITVTAADGATAECHVPFPPIDGDLATHSCRDRRVGVLLVRRGGYAVGIFDGVRLTASKVGSRHVQGRTAAGGWSQQRFARRREGQARVAKEAAADVAAALLLPELESLDAVVVGGDRAAGDSVLRDVRLAPLAPLVGSRRLDVPEPRLRVLESTPALFRAVRVRVVEPV